jgi:metal-sulfur cluster biosynthetic enzyme
VEGIESCKVGITFDPPWDRSMLSEEARLELGFL